MARAYRQQLSVLFIRPRPLPTIIAVVLMVAVVVVVGLMVAVVVAGVVTAER